MWLQIELIPCSVANVKNVFLLEFLPVRIPNKIEKAPKFQIVDFKMLFCNKCVILPKNYGFDDS